LISASCESCRKLIKICEEENSELRHIAVRMLTKFSYATAIDILDKHIDGDDEDCLTACQSIFWYAKDKSIDWADRLKNRLAQVSSDETFRFITYILREVKIDYSENIKPFCTHENEEVRVTAFYSLGQLKNKSRFIDEFIVGLQDESPRVVHITLQALVGIKDKRLLDSYIKIIERFKADENYVLTNLDHRLKDMGYGNRSKFAKRFGIYGIDGLSKRNKSLADVFKKIFR
jgi:HEAT repeat protein